MSRKKIWSKTPKKTKAKMKAAKLIAKDIKCRRCNSVFYKKKGTIDTICSKCKARCFHCDQPLTSQTLPTVQNKNTYCCLECKKKLARASKYRNGGFKQGSPEARAKYNASRMRAGKHKCSRCKVVFNRERGTGYMICLRCREHCSRCDVFLTTLNSAKRSNSNSFRCKSCDCESAKLTSERDCSRDRRLVKVFGITLPEYEAILSIQNKVCWICQKPPKEGGRRLSVDHLHAKNEKKRNPREKRGRVRGLLCWRCNSSIGKFNDNITLLRRAANYLEEWPAQKILKEKI